MKLTSYIKLHLVFIVILLLTGIAANASVNTSLGYSYSFHYKNAVDTIPQKPVSTPSVDNKNKGNKGKPDASAKIKEVPKARPMPKPKVVGPKVKPVKIKPNMGPKIKL